MNLLPWAAVIAVSFCTASAAFFLFYLLWLRRFARKLFETQVMLYKMTALFQKARKAEKPSRAAVRPRPAPPREPSAAGEGRRISMSVEGRGVEIVEIDGREVVRIEDGEALSAAQRSRILAYLRDEGFLSD